MTKSTKTLRFLKSRGYNGQIVRAGAVVEVSEFWTKIFITDGTAEEVETKKAEPPKKKGENNGKSKR